MKLSDKLREEPIILSHHPSCDRFKDHVMNFRGIALCRGCFLVYPTTVIVLIILNLPIFPSFSSYITYFILSVIFFTINLIRKVLKIKNLWWQNFSRISIGISLAMAITSVLKAPSTSIQVILVIIIFSIAGIYNVINGFHNLRVCKSCEEHRDFPHCQGSTHIR